MLDVSTSTANTKAPFIISEDKNFMSNMERYDQVSFSQSRRSSQNIPPMLAYNAAEVERALYEGREPVPTVLLPSTTFR